MTDKVIGEIQTIEGKLSLDSCHGATLWRVYDHTKEGNDLMCNLESFDEYEVRITIERISEHNSKGKVGVK